MPNLTTVGVTDGVPDSGTGTVSTLDNLVGPAGTAATNVVSVQGIASMTKLLVTPDANSAVNVAQVNGATINIGSGSMSTGTARVALATDSPGVTALGQTTMLFSLPVAIASNQSAIPTAGDIANDAADSGNPIKNGYVATTAISGLTLVASGDRVNGYAGVDGVQIVRPHCNLEGIVSGNASNTDGTSTQVIATAGSGIKQYLTSVILTNTSATAIYVEMKSGTTVKATIPLPAGSGAIFNPPVPLPPNAADEAWNFDPSAAATTVYCTAIGFKSKI